MRVNNVETNELIKFLNNTLKPKKTTILTKTSALSEEGMDAVAKELQALANSSKANINIASKGNLLLINSGAKTSAHNILKIETNEDFLNIVRDNLFENRMFRK